MSVEDAVPGRLVRWISAAVPDWDAVYEEQLPRIYNFLRYRIGNHPNVEDLTSLTFEKAWRARHRYRRDIAGFTTWLLTIARNVATDYFRRSQREAPLDAAAGQTLGVTPEDDYLQPPIFRDLQIGPPMFWAASTPTSAMVVWSIGFVIVTMTAAVRTFDRRAL